jgi:hypothetical protein
MWKLIWYGVIAILIGIIVLILGYFWSDEHSSHYYPFASFLALNLGGLLIFSAGYTLLTEFQLKRDFARDMSASIDEKLRTVELNRTIIDSGLTEILQRFSDELLSKRIAEAATVKMLVMRNDTFFRANHEELRARIAGGQFNLEVALPNPRNAALMTILSTKYSDLPDANRLGQSIADSANTWLREQIWRKCDAQQRDRFRLRLSDTYPLYSAYLFDDKELWYIPYHQRKNWHPIPVFIYRTNVKTLELYKDLQEVFGTTPVDLNNPL